MHQPKLCFIGFGNMAKAIADGLNVNDYKQITAADPYIKDSPSFIQPFKDNEQACVGADIIVLAVKPQQIETACSTIVQHVKAEALIISVAAGITINKLSTLLGKNIAIIRAMPNTPAVIQKAATGLFANQHVTHNQHQYAEKLFTSIGIVEWVVEESLIDVITALSGSGPAYAFLLIEAMKKSAIELGLPETIAHSFALQTCEGAAQMANESSIDVKQLRHQVTSPGGTTAAALETLEKNNFTSLIKQAMIAALTRAKQLSG